MDWSQLVDSIRKMPQMLYYIHLTEPKEFGFYDLITLILKRYWGFCLYSENSATYRKIHIWIHNFHKTVCVRVCARACVNEFIHLVLNHNYYTTSYTGLPQPSYNVNVINLIDRCSSWTTKILNVLFIKRTRILWINWDR